MTGGVLLPAVAGTWYPADALALARLVDELLVDPGGEAAPAPARALVVPHAGFAYSGRVAGLGFVRLPRDIDRVLLVGPTHYSGFPGIAVPCASLYRTPLGDVPIDVETVAGIAESAAVRREDRPFGPEHSLEAELPFLQRRLRPGWRVVPVLVGSLADASRRRDVLAALRPAFDERTVAVISSDFTHYGPRFGYVPFTERVADRIRELDESAIACLVVNDADAFREHVRNTRATICGRAAIEVLLGLLTPASRGALVAYDTSGRITGDFEHSVSYASIAFR